MAGAYPAVEKEIPDGSTAFDVVRELRESGVRRAENDADSTLRLLERLDVDFEYHAPTEAQVRRMAHIRAEAKRLGQTLVLLCPAPSRELSQALTALEQAVMHANASIVRNERPVLPPPPAAAGSGG